MRRFVAYLSLAIAGIATIGATYNSVITKTDSNIEYKDGTAKVFRITSDNKDVPVEEGASKEIAKKMEERLNIYGETRYDVVTMGNDMVKVIVSGEKDDERVGEIENYLSFDGSFAIGTANDDIALDKIDHFMDNSKKAYLKVENLYPTVVIPINKESEMFQTVIKKAEELSTKEDEQSDPESEEHKATYLYLAYNFTEDDNISDMLKDTEEGQALAKKKLLLPIDFANIWFDEEKTAIQAPVNFQNAEGQITSADVSKATHHGNYIVNLVNADPLPYEVDCIYSQNAPAYFENIISLNDTVAWSRTLTATLFAILILSLLLAVFYRWGAVAIGSLSIASVFAGLGLTILFSVEFNTAAIIGLCAVALASIASGIVYFTKVKEETYRGRTLKKANAEGAKRALLPIVDINLVLIIIGACVYWLGGKMMISFAATSVFGGIVSLILNTLALKGMAWLLTNTTKFQGNYTVIGVENSRVPNLLNEEKQTYFGAYQDAKPTKHKKAFGITAAVLFVASLVGTITLGSLKDGVIFNDKGYTKDNSYLMIESTRDVQVVGLKEVDDLLKYSEYIEYKEDATDEDWKNAKAFTADNYVAEKINDPFVEVNDGVTTKTHYLIITMDSSFTGDEIFKVYASEEAQKAGTVLYQGNLVDIFKDYNHADSSVKDDTLEVAFRHGTRVNAQQPNYSMIIAGVAVGVAFAVLYLMLRYGFSRGVVGLIATTLTGFITVGIFSLTTVKVGLDLFIALPLVMMFVLTLAIFFINKDKEMVRDDSVKSKDDTYEHREELTLKANALALSPILVFSAMGIYLTVNFFGFGVAATSNIFMFGLVGVIISIVAVAVLYAPTQLLIVKIMKKLNIHKIDIKKPRNTKKKKKAIKNKSAEPEEAIFIGIND